MNSLKKLQILFKIDVSYNSERKIEFHIAARAVARKIAEAMGLKKGEYDIRSNMGGIAVSGEIILHSDTFYLYFEQSCMGPRGDILYRSCEGRKDYTGGRNNFYCIDELVDHWNDCITSFKKVAGLWTEGE